MQPRPVAEPPLVRVPGAPEQTSRPKPGDDRGADGHRPPLRRWSSGYHSLEGDPQPAEAPVYGPANRPSRPRRSNAAGDMQAVDIGRQLREIGDDFNRHIQRREARRHGQHGIQPDHLRLVPGFLLCGALLLLVIGWRFQDDMFHSQFHFRL